MTPQVPQLPPFHYPGTSVFDKSGKERVCRSVEEYEKACWYEGYSWQKPSKPVPAFPAK